MNITFRKYFFYFQKMNDLAKKKFLKIAVFKDFWVFNPLYFRKI